MSRSKLMTSRKQSRFNQDVFNLEKLDGEGDAFFKLGEHQFFATIGEAVSRYLESQSVPWVDWEYRTK